MIAILFAAAVAAPPSADAAADPPKAKPRLVCHSEIPTGSVMPKRVCLTPEQAAARVQADRRDKERMQSQIGPAGDMRPN